MLQIIAVHRTHKLGFGPQIKQMTIPLNKLLTLFDSKCQFFVIQKLLEHPLNFRKVQLPKVHFFASNINLVKAGSDI